MKKKQILFVIIAVLAGLIIIKVALNYPPSSKEDLSGTIGKVDKYRKVQLTEKDVILRKEFISDTSKLAKSIRGLVYCNAFAKDYANDLKVYSDYLKKNKPDLKYVKELEEYISYINNNASSVENAIGLLLDIYSSDTTSYSANAESKLKAFDSFVYEMIKRDSVVSLLIPGLEKEITKIQKSQGNKNEDLKMLKNLHDQMILKDIQMGCLFENQGSLKVLMNTPLYDARNLGLYQNGTPDLNGYNNVVCQKVLSRDNFGAFNKHQIDLYIGMAGDHMAVIAPGAKVFNSQHVLNLININNKDVNNVTLGPAFMNHSLDAINTISQIGSVCCNSVNSFGTLIWGSAIENSAQFQASFTAYLPNNYVGHIELEYIIANQELGNRNIGNRGQQ